MLSPSIPCKGLRPLTHSRDFVGYIAYSFRVLILR